MENLWTSSDVSSCEVFHFHQVARAGWKGGRDKRSLRRKEKADTAVSQSKRETDSKGAFETLSLVFVPTSYTSKNWGRQSVGFNQGWAQLSQNDETA